MMADSARLRIGVIVDRHRLARWQLDALRTLRDCADLLLYSCNNTQPGSRRPRHALYYLLNLFTIRNRLTRRTRWPADLAVVGGCEFDALQAGNWQELPPSVIEQIATDRVDAIVKFGMGLLRVPPAGEFSVPILSYHHGDPARYRGRPAGFYEMLDDEPVIGQVVQRLSNRLDAGEILAFAETKVAPHSYRATLTEAYRHSPLLLRQAVSNSVAARSWKPRRWGKNYRLPTNRLVMTLLLKQLRRTATRIFYGLFKEKRWNVATVKIDDSASTDSIAQFLSQPTMWQVEPLPRGYRFLADPFFHPIGGLLVEGFNARSSRGEILHITGGTARRISGDGGHFSYPATYCHGDQWHVIPEISEWSPVRSYPLGGTALGQPAALRIPGRPALLDPTPFQHEGVFYLFANLAVEGPSVLRLWMAQDLWGEFAEHPSSPIRLSPHGSRMAGSICRHGDGLIRVGQDLRREYGDGISFFRIMHLDRQRYREELVGDFRFHHCKGPHTLNFGNGRAAFDFYDERLAPLAGVRRVWHRRAARNSAQAGRSR